MSFDKDMKSLSNFLLNILVTFNTPLYGVYVVWCDWWRADNRVLVKLENVTCLFHWLSRVYYQFSIIIKLTWSWWIYHLYASSFMVECVTVIKHCFYSFVSYVDNLQSTLPMFYYTAPELDFLELLCLNLLYLILLSNQYLSFLFMNITRIHTFWLDLSRERLG